MLVSLTSLKFYNVKYYFVRGVHANIDKVELPSAKVVTEKVSSRRRRNIK